MKAKQISPNTRRAKDYGKMFGRCGICDAPIWYTRIIDNTGTPILAYHCWNGHYESLDPQLLDLYNRNEDISAEDIKRILPFIKFIRLSQ